MDSIELIRKFLHERLGVEPEKVQDESVLTELGVDSLMVAELMFEAEDRLDITIDNTETIPVTVGDMRQIIDRLLVQKAAQA
ncbi:MAG: acyl carrier protein [Proteobacteria bacterium]|nr:acyl carrier protein [Pseudomonadota bacterium]